MIGERPDPDQASFEELCATIAACNVVLTDTYHLAVNCWRLGTPAVCVVDAPGAAWSVNSGAAGSRRDKRFDLYSQLDAMDFLVDGASLRAFAMSAEIDRLVAALFSPAVDTVTGRTRALARQSHRLVSEAISHLLDRAR